MIAEKYLPLIQDKLNELFKEQKVSRNTSVEEMIALVDRDVKLKLKFKQLLIPNKYLEVIYDFLDLNGSCSISMLIVWFYKFYWNPAEEPEKPKHKTVHKGFTDELLLLYTFNLITVRVLDYTSFTTKEKTISSQTKIYRAPFSTEEQFNFAVEYYSGYEQGFREMIKSRAEKHNYYHPSEKPKKAKITGAEILEGAAVKAAKKKADHIMKEVSSELYHCCGISLKNQEQLNAHWKSKYIIYRENQQLPYQSKGLFQDGDKICRECWSAYDSCEHNCEAKYYADKRKLQQQLTNILQTPTTLQLEGEK